MKDKQINEYIEEIKRLKEENELYLKIIENARTGISISDVTKKDDGNLVAMYVNKTFSRLTGYTKEEAIGKNLRFLQGEDKDQDGIKEMSSAIKEQRHTEVTLRNYKKTGELFWNMVTLSPIFDDDGKLHYYVGTQHDITKLKNQEQELEEQKNFMHTVLDSQANMILITKDDEVEYANRSFFGLFDAKDTYEFKRNYGCVCNGFIEDDRFFHMGKVKSNESWVEVLSHLEPHEQIVSLVCPRLEGKAFKVEVRDFEDGLHIINFSDISQNIIRQFEIEDQAMKDELTKLHNRKFFEKSAKLFVIDAEAKGNKTAVVLLDIDHFKSVNDNYGHNVGDEVLKGVAKALKETLRKQDMLVRWGGEEFLVLSAIEDEAQLINISEKLRKKIESLVFDAVGNVSASFGVTTYESSKTMLQNIADADSALYESKRRGRNQTTSFKEI